MPYSRSDILNQNTSDFPNNNSGQITPAILRDFNANFVNSVVFIGDPTVSASYAATASIATSASYANTATLAATASFFSGSVVSASYALNATSATTAATASFTPNAVVTASSNVNIITFTKGNGTTFDVAIAVSGSVATASFAATAGSASYAATASFTPNAVVTASASSNVITFTKGGGTTFTVTVGSVIDTGSFATTGSNTFTGSQTINGNLNVFGTSNFISGSGLQVRGNSFSVEDNSSVTKFQVNTAANLIVVRLPMSASEGITGSLFGTASYATQALSASWAPSVTFDSSSFATLGGNNVFTGSLNTFQNAVTMSNVRVTGTASVAFLYVEVQSSSIIFSSGSNQLGDASNDTQTLWGTVVLPSGPLQVTGSVSSTGGFTGSLQGIAETASVALAVSTSISKQNA